MAPTGYTPSAKSEDLKETWYYVDAEGKVLGQLAADIASVLRGKHMVNFTPHVNMRTHVVVLNAGKVHLTGRKWTDKLYRDHSGWRGGLRTAAARDLNAKKPGELVRRAVQGMLPKTRLGDATMKRLRIFEGAEHTHKAQRPVPLPLRTQKAEVA